MKVVVITGASSGIGRATALELASPGTRLVLTARRRERLDALESDVRARGGQASSIVADLEADNEAARVMDQVEADQGRIDVLINNAGVGYFGTFENTPRAVMDRVLAVNFVAPFLMAQRVLPVMKRQGSGHIINISSIVGKRGLPLSAVYSASKFALNGISEALRVELRDTGIHVSSVYPVATRTEFFDVVHTQSPRGRFRPAGPVQPAEAVARAIARCIRRPRAEVYPYWPARLMVWLNAVFPGAVERAMRVYARRRLEALE